MKGHIFLIVTPKFKLESHYTLEVKKYLFPVYQLLFAYVFSYQSHPQCHIIVFVPGEKIKSKREVKLCKMCLRGQGQSVESENCNGHNPLILMVWIPDWTKELKFWSSGSFDVGFAVWRYVYKGDPEFYFPWRCYWHFMKVPGVFALHGTGWHKVWLGIMCRPSIL